MAMSDETATPKTESTNGKPPRNKLGQFMPGYTYNPAGRPKGSKTKSLNFWLKKALNEEIQVALADGTKIYTTPAEIIGKIIAKAVVSGDLHLQGRVVPLDTKELIAFLTLVFKQVSPPVEKVDLTVREGIEELTDEQLLELYSSMMDGEDDEEGFNFDGFGDQGED